MQTVIKQFMDFELRENLFDNRVGDFQIWPYLRFTVYMKIEEKLNDQKKRASAKERLPIKAYLKIFANCTFKSPGFRAKKKDVLFVAHARRSLIDGKYECLYTDELAESFDNGVSAEFIFGMKHFKPARTQNLLDLDYIDILPMIKRKFVARKFKAELAEIDKFCRSLGQKLKDTFGVDIGDDFIASTAKKRFIWHYLKKQMLRKLLKKISPKAIVEVVSYETNKMLINEIANDMGIPTIELQHGVIGRGHVAYNYREKMDFPYMPKYVCLFSKYWADTAAFPQKEENLIPTGYPYLERMMKKFPVCTERGGDGRCLNLLVISQPEFSIKLYDEILKLIEVLDEKKMEYKLFYKLHPAEYSLGAGQFDKIRKNPSVEVIDSSAVNLYELFAKSDIQIGITSTAIFEGLAYNLETLILHYEKTEEYMGDVCGRGLATMCEDYRELAGHIAGFVPGKALKGESPFFIPGAKENIVNFINSTMIEEE